MRTIKRYANRKLYDTLDSRYVTLDQIADMIRRGEDVKVVDNSSKEDLTSVTLAQIIFEEEKRKKSFLPLSALRKVIQTGGESLHEFVATLQESAGRVVHESAGRVGRVFRRDDGELVEGEEAEALESGENSKSEPVKMLREFIDGVQHTIDDWQKRVDSNLHNALESVSPLAPLQKEVTALHERIEDLERKLADVPTSQVSPDAVSSQT